MSSDFEFSKKMSYYGDLLRGLVSIYTRKKNMNAEAILIALALSVAVIFFAHNSPYKFSIFFGTVPFMVFQVVLCIKNTRRRNDLHDLLISCHHIISHETLDAMTEHIVNKYLAGAKVSPTLMGKYADLNP